MELISSLKKFEDILMHEKIKISDSLLIQNELKIHLYTINKSFNQLLMCKG